MPERIDLAVIPGLDDATLQRRIESLEFLLFNWERARIILELGVREGQKALDEHDESVQAVREDLTVLQAVQATRMLASLGVDPVTS